MVRNTNGGCKSKGLARKLQQDGGSTGQLRLPVEEGEMVAVVRRMLGNGRVVVCLAGGDGIGSIEIQCVIRNKFRGRSKRNHLVSVGSIVLVGLYTWEKPSYKTSDLLHIYGSSDIAQLLHMKLIPVGFVTESSSGVFGSGKGVGDDLLTFEDNRGDDGEMEKELVQKVPVRDLPPAGMELEEELPDFDDI